MKKNAASARYEGILLIPARDADFCQELLEMGAISRPKSTGAPNRGEKYGKTRQHYFAQL